MLEFYGALLNLRMLYVVRTSVEILSHLAKSRRSFLTYLETLQEVAMSLRLLSSSFRWPSATLPFPPLLPSPESAFPSSTFRSNRIVGSPS